MLMKSALLVATCTILLPPAMVAASELTLDNVSLKGLLRYKDSGGGEFVYYEPSAVPQAQDTKFVFGAYSWKYPEKGRMIPITTDVAYIVDCKRESLTQVFESRHLTAANLTLLPPDIQKKAIGEKAERMVTVQGLNFTSPTRVVYMRDTAALEVACKLK